MKSTHKYTGATDRFKMADYTNIACFTAATTAYTSSNEVTGTNYTANGNFLTSVTPTTSGTTARGDFADEVCSDVTISSVRGGLIYNEAASCVPSVVVLVCVADEGSISGDCTFVVPTADAFNAIILLA